jgi:hypothetical protein
LKNNTYPVFFVFLFVIFFQTGNFLFAQTVTTDSIPKSTDTLQVSADSTSKKKKVPKIRKPTVPWKAALMSGFVPGLGQIYNRKYWKLPIVWGAIGTTGYFLVDQHIQYINYRNAYRALINDTIVLPGFEAYANNPGGLQSQRDAFERNRNILTIVAAVLWTLNIVDAAVDAHLSSFDVSPNLSMKIKPATLFNTYNSQPAIGISFTLGFK